MGASLVTGPTVEPVTLAEVREHLRISDTNSDAALAGLIFTARVDAEGQLRRALITQTWRMTIDGAWPLRIEFPVQPVQSVSSITYVDTAGATQTLASDQYVLKESGADGIAYIVPAYGVTWPAIRDIAQAITVTFVAGYGNPGDVPQPIRTALMFHVELLYDRNVQTRDLVESARDALLAPFRVVRV